jgi:hypothetical protein
MRSAHGRQHGARGSRRASGSLATRHATSKDTALTPLFENGRQTQVGRRIVPLSPQSHFHRAAASVSVAIAALSSCVAARRREYCDPLRCSDADRDALDAEVAATVAECRQRIDELTQAAPAAAGGEGDSLGHHMGVVVCLAERLADAASRFDSLRSQRARLALDTKAARRGRAAPVPQGDGGQVRCWPATAAGGPLFGCLDETPFVFSLTCCAAVSETSAAQSHAICRIVIRRASAAERAVQAPGAGG